MRVCVQRRQDEIARQPGWRVGAVQLIQKSLIPCVDAVPEDLGDDLEKTFPTKTLALGKVECQPLRQVLRGEGVHERVFDSTIGTRKQCPCGTRWNSIVSLPDEWDNQLFDGRY